MYHVLPMAYMAPVVTRFSFTTVLCIDERNESESSKVVKQVSGLKIYT